MVKDVKVVGIEEALSVMESATSKESTSMAGMMVTRVKKGDEEILLIQGLGGEFIQVK